MALLPDELTRVRYELGYNIFGVAAEPYIEYFGVFDQVVQRYISSGATTTSNTAVTAAASPTPVTLTLADATGFSAGAHVFIDVDTLQEEATVRSVSGSTISVMLKLAHPAGYPVTVDGGESIVRSILKRLRDIVTALGTTAINTAGLKRVDVIEFYGNSAAISQSTTLATLRDKARDELASALGVTNLWRMRGAANNSIAVY